MRRTDENRSIDLDNLSEILHLNRTEEWTIARDSSMAPITSPSLRTEGRHGSGTPSDRNRIAENVDSFGLMITDCGSRAECRGLQRDQHHESPSDQTSVRPQQRPDLRLSETRADGVHQPANQ